MSDQDRVNDGALVPKGRRELAPVAGANPLVSRGLDEIGRLLKVGEAVRSPSSNSLFYYNRGVARLGKKDYDNAISDFEMAISLDPRDADAYWNRGRAWFAKKEYDKAIRDYDEAVRLKPKDMMAYFLRGAAWFSKKDYDRAIKDLDQAIRLDPKDRSAFATRALARRLKKDHDKAAEDYAEAIRLAPTDPNAYSGLAWMLATCPEEKVRNGKLAIHLATKACELASWNSSWLLATLAAAYAEVGQFDEAERWQRKALEDPDYRANEEFHQRLELYKQKRPYRDRC